jgi:MSHA biogenesis protein MshJ
MKIIWWQDPRIVSGLEKYRELSTRERKLVLITAHVVIAAVLVFFIAAPIWAIALKDRQQANELESNSLRLEAHLQRLRSTPVLDPNDAVRDDIEKVLGQKAVVDERIQSLTDTLVAPENMPSVLESMMTQDTRLKLISLENTEGQSIALGSEFSDVDLYRHGMKIRMSADYPSLMSYLQRLDSMPWKLYWQSLDYTVENYPGGELYLEVFTLSTREEILSD